MHPNQKINFGINIPFSFLVLNVGPALNPEVSLSLGMMIDEIKNASAGYLVLRHLHYNDPSTVLVVALTVSLCQQQPMPAASTYVSEAGLFEGDLSPTAREKN
jgi:hypothetical protein